MVQLPKVNRRRVAKEVTEARVLAAAEILFSQQGWDATMRDIARLARVSTGSIFNSFRDKQDLLAAVLQEDLSRLQAEFEAVMARDAPVQDSMLDLFMTAYRHYDGRLPLLRAMRHLMWSDEGEGIRELIRSFPIYDIVRRRLERAAASGEIAGDRLGLRTHMLVDAYVSAYAKSIHGSWDLTALRRSSEGRIQVILGLPG